MSEPKPMPTYWSLAEEVTHLHGRLDQLEAENAKLRELVQRMLRNMHGCNYYHSCGSCDFDECVYEANLRELGIEVDKT